MKNVLIAIIAFVGIVVVGCGSPSEPEGSTEQSQKCSPTDVNCLGGPDGQPCGNHHQICCSINGYAFDCLNHNPSQTCNPTSYTCVDSAVHCLATCANPAGVYLPFQVSGSATPGQVYTVALWHCLGAGANYVYHTCDY